MSTVVGGLLSCGDMAELAERRSLVRLASVGGTVEVSKVACTSVKKFKMCVFKKKLKVHRVFCVRINKEYSVWPHDTGGLQ